MPEVETKMVKSHMLEYKSWMSDDKYYMSLTEWQNGEGFDLTIEGKGKNEKISLHNQDMAALLVLYGRYQIEI